MSNSPIIITCTTQNEPAPYANIQKFELTKEEGSLLVSFKMEYLDRGTITAEEIYDEGFTEEDDYTWIGKLSKPWVDEFNRVIERTSYKNNYDELEPLRIEITVADRSEGESKYPSEYVMWEDFIQELTQAVFETSGHELPLKIEIKEISKTESIDYAIYGSFAERSARVIRNNSEIEIPWHELKPMIKTVFMPDYLPELAMDRAPKKRGVFLSMEGEIWYKLGHAILEPSKKSKTLERLERLVSELSEL
jgi:hypothetical protein